MVDDPTILDVEQIRSMLTSFENSDPVVWQGYGRAFDANEELTKSLNEEMDLTFAKDRYRGVDFEHPKCQQDISITLCSDVTVKDRRGSNQAESLNAAMGLDTSLKVLVGGNPQANGLFQTYLHHHDRLLYERYEQVATLCNSPLGPDLQLLHGAEIAFAGKVSFFRANGTFVG